MFCKDCGSQLPDRYKFCEVCGAETDSLIAFWKFPSDEPFRPEGIFLM